MHYVKDGESVIAHVREMAGTIVCEKLKYSLKKIKLEFYSKIVFLNVCYITNTMAFPTISNVYINRHVYFMYINCYQMY